VSLIKIDSKIIGKTEPTFFIADIAANHDGDIERAKDLIYLAAESGANAAKFQHFDAKTIVSDYGFKNLKNKLSHQKTWNKSIYSVYEDASIDLNWTKTLKETCDKANIIFFSTPYSLELVDHLKDYVPAYKIGSGDITWLEILEAIARTLKPLFLATGASDMREVDVAVKTILQHNTKLCLMQCNTNYTGDIKNFNYVNLNVLKEFKNKYPDLILGLSDHTPGLSTTLGAVALGARVIEKHFTDNNNRLGPDHVFSMNPQSWRDMVDRTRELELSLGKSIKQVEENERETVIVQRRSIRVNKDLKKGSIINRKDIIVLRPCPEDAYQISEMNNILGNKLKRDINKGDYIKASDI
tara:strand:+ start:1631 stop:2695 length:1065 start_codon:yes stop_codon:yes gene_type:complete